MLKAIYVTRSFLDYSVPVFKELSDLFNGKLHVIFSSDYVPDRVTRRIIAVLGERAIGMRGERRIGPNEDTGFANSTYRLVYQPGLIKQISSIKPDVLIGDGFFQWTFYAYLYKLWRATPLVVCYERTFHTERKAQWIRTAYRRFVLRYIDSMCCNGTLCSEYTQWLGMPINRITTGHMVASTESMAEQAATVSDIERKSLRQNWGEHEIVFLSVGRLIQLKGYRELLQAWAMLQQKVSHFAALVIVGSGPEEENLKNIVQSLSLKSVFFVPHVDYDQIAKYYASADVLVMPTLEDNWSLVVPEAMACGLPVLCSKYNGCWPELIKPDVNGWVFDPLCVEDTCNTLHKCLEAKNHLKEMGTESKAIVSQFTPSHAAKAILDACQIAIDHSKGSKK